MGHYCSLDKSIITIISKVPQNDSMGTKVYQKNFHQNISILRGALLLGVIMGHYYSLKKSIITIIHKVPQNDRMGTKHYQKNFHQIISTLSGPAGVFAHSLGSLPLFFFMSNNLNFGEKNLM